MEHNRTEEIPVNQKNPFRTTILASFIGYIVQAIVNNFAPLLFLTFRSSYHLSLDRISILVTFNFGVQLLIDLLASQFIGKIGYRTAIVGAHLFAGAGLIAMAVLPELLPNAVAGLLLSVALYAIGGGLIEVLVSPIVEACPSDNKPALMSLLHSFYCWGQLGVVLLSTLFFSLAGIGNWRILSVIWAIVPLANAVFFARVPLRTMEEASSEHTGLGQLVRMGSFWIMILMMFCAGACELSISQWASAFAESALGITKTLGDLLGPCLFAALMGLSRVIHAKMSDRLRLERYMLGCVTLCMAGYLLASLTHLPALGLIGCAACGYAVGVMWPGTYSLAARELPGGGSAMFALLALGGDLGCSAGPTLVGLVSGACGDSLKTGLLAATVFPLLLVAVLVIREWRHKKAA